MGRKTPEMDPRTTIPAGSLHYFYDPSEPDNSKKDCHIEHEDFLEDTGITDLITDVDNLQIDLEDLAGYGRTTETVKANADAIAAIVTGTIPTGLITMYGAATAPSGFLLCDGSAVSRSTYAALFGVIGETWGVGDGSTTFNVPDMRNIVPYGANAATRDISGITHPATPLGTTHNDRGQGWQLGMAQIATGGPVYFGSTRLDNYIINGTVSAGQAIIQMKNNQQGVATAAKAYNDGTNGTPRTGATTMAAGIGVNFIIKT